MMLEVQDIHTYYGESYVLQGVSLKIAKGSIVAVLGRNGVGKTTLLRSIIGFTPPKRGRIIFKGVDISHLPPYRISKMGIGLVPQGRRIFPSLTVQENLGIAERRGPEKRGRWSLERVLSLFPPLRERLSHLGRELSGGEQQMLASARGLIGNPELLLMDEPTEGLAPLLVREQERLLHYLKEEEGVSILLVEQNIPFALKVADYVYILSKGKIVYESLPEELRHADEVRQRYLGV